MGAAAPCCAPSEARGAEAGLWGGRGGAQEWGNRGTSSPRHQSPKAQKNPSLQDRDAGTRPACKAHPESQAGRNMGWGAQGGDAQGEDVTVTAVSCHSDSRGSVLSHSHSLRLQELE